MTVLLRNGQPVTTAAHTDCTVWQLALDLLHRNRAGCCEILTVCRSVSPSVRHICCFCMLSWKHKGTVNPGQFADRKAAGEADEDGVMTDSRWSALYRLCRSSQRWVWLAGPSAGRSVRRTVQTAIQRCDSIVHLSSPPLPPCPPVPLRNIQRFLKRCGGDFEPGVYPLLAEMD